MSPTSATPTTERSTLYFDALSSPRDFESDQNPLDVVTNNHLAMNDTSNQPQAGVSGFSVPQAPGSVLPAAIEQEEHNDSGIKNPFGGREGEAESPGWLPAVDGDEETVANTQRNAVFFGGGETQGQLPSRRNSVGGPQRPPVPKRPASFHSGHYGAPNANNGIHSRKASINSFGGQPSVISSAGAMPNGDQQQQLPPNANAQPPPGVALYDPGVVPANSVPNQLAASGNDALHARDKSADSVLTPKQKSKLDKIQRKESKKLSKIIKQEGKVEKDALSAQIHELEELQKLQKAAVKREASAHTKHTNLANSFQKVSQQYFALRTKYEAHQAQLLAEEADLEDARRAVKDIAERIKERKEEVEATRVRVGVEDKEREVRLGQLSAKIRGDRKSSIWK
ncbi:hypothetical protein ONZ45_g10785 [Pleurotus djamor]|nr:hypothetical protein ONZ45_g10785 [Pleurotus djamor]